MKREITAKATAPKDRIASTKKMNSRKRPNSSKKTTRAEKVRSTEDSATQKSSKRLTTLNTPHMLQK